MLKTGNNSGHSAFMHCMFRSTKVACQLKKKLNISTRFSITYKHKQVLSPHVTFVQSLFAKSWTKQEMSPKCVCPFSTKTAENNWKFVCTGKAWLIIVTWHQKVQMTKKWTCRLFRAQRWHVQFLVIWTFWCQVTSILAKPFRCTQFSVIFCPCLWKMLDSQFVT